MESAWVRLKMTGYGGGPVDVVDVGESNDHGLRRRGAGRC